MFAGRIVCYGNSLKKYYLYYFCLFLVKISKHILNKITVFEKQHCIRYYDLFSEQKCLVWMYFVLLLLQAFSCFCFQVKSCQCNDKIHLYSVVDKVHRSSTWVKVQIRIIKYYSSKSKSTAFSILLEWKYKSTQFFMYLSKKVLIDRFILQFYIDYFI